MKLREILRFELVYQARRVRTWLYFAILFAVAYLAAANAIDGARHGGTLATSPFTIATITVITSLLWVVMAPAVAGSAAARDVRTRMHPLVYTTPVSKADYLGGRFLAAFALNGLILLAVPVGILFAVLLSGAESDILGPFRPAAYLSTYGLIALPTAFAITAIQFWLAVLSRKVVASYLASVLLAVILSIAGQTMADVLLMPTLGKVVDPIGYATVLGVLSRDLTPTEKNTLLIGLEGSMLATRVLWVVLGLGVLALTHRRFRFGDRAEGRRRRRRASRDEVTQGMRRTQGMRSELPASAGIAGSARIAIPEVRRTFGFATHARQMFAIAWTSFGTIAKSPAGLVLLAIAILLVLVLPLPPLMLHHLGVPLLPRTAHLIPLLTAPIANNPITPWVLIPLLIIVYAGELIWREREAVLSEIADAAPAPEWVLFLGKFLGLGLVLVMWMAFLTTAGMLVQARMGYFDFEIGVYLKILFGLQLVDYLLFALLVFSVHAVVNQKHLGYLVALIAYGVMTFPSAFGIEHNLLVFGSDPGWSYSDMRGFGPSLWPWVWFKLYWAAWALLFAVAARLLWVRGTESDFGVRLRMAHRRLTRPTAWAAAAAVGLILTVGGFIFYNTNVLNEYRTAADRTVLRAENNRYRPGPQPWLTDTALHVDIYPRRREVQIRGSYRLANRSAVAIDSIHAGVATAADVETGELSFDRPAARVAADEDPGRRVYALETPLQPADSVRVGFEVHFKPRGFRHRGVDYSVVANGTYFTNENWLPAIGFPRPSLRSLDNVEARRAIAGDEWIGLDVVVSTDEDQVAVAPGILRKTWTEGGRRYFHYSADAPIRNRYAIFSADYAVHETQWKDVAIQIFHDPRHTTNLDRIVRGVQASLSYHTERFGPYPYRYLRFVERPRPGVGMHAEAANISYDEGFSQLNPGGRPRGADLPFTVVAHEVAHQWWGHQLAPAHVQGEALLTESLAMYSAIQAVEKTDGPEQQRRFLGLLRTPFNAPNRRAGAPVLRAANWFDAYRKGPFALYALSRYIGEERVNEALRRMLEKYPVGTPTLPTSLDLYRELQAVTPESQQSLLHDLFAANTVWDFETKRATAKQTQDGTWQVTLDVEARKVTVDNAGVETAIPMDDWVQVGIFARAERGNGVGEPIYEQSHRIHSGEQTITVTVPREPARAGIDPRHVLTYLEEGDRLAEVKIER